jgi:tRNA(fMet)-specific endonuclease VapC
VEGLVFDTTIIAAAERSRESIERLLLRTRNQYGSLTIALATVSAVELNHGLQRASTEAIRQRRKQFLDDAYHAFLILPLTLEIAQLAGQIEGEQAAKGIGIPFEDLLIAATALHHSYGVATLNTKHFLLIPGLSVISL